MKEFTYTIKDQLGIHARPAGMLVKEAKKFGSAITIRGKNGKSSDVSKILNLMAMGIKHGDVITVQADGKDEEAAISAMKVLVTNNL
ncbi:HPr family phosphocarrier protein [Clostridium sp. KNHs216]|jgi:Phosphotransferase System HPr (HPr) Family|uniref:HPr family phosphocarrier protein n=1 Tax=Clostridium sp. KNHs216 TaxID=1550235 RepID=UPI0011540C69|nr:HPr family phosphocarrier protein [Clostridium sp. KNHs216]TQI68500.1 phosphocarrier protein [Clostridium sp. KNHs216]